MSFRREEMWPEDRHDYERVPHHRSRGMHPEEECRRIVNIVHKNTPLDRLDDGSGRRYEDYGHVEYRDYEEGHRFGHERRSGPQYRGDDPGYRYHRDEHHGTRQPDYREDRESFRRKPFYPPPYMRERSPQKRDSPLYRDSPGNRRDSPPSRSGSSMSSRSYSPDRSKSYSSHQHTRTKDRIVVQTLTSRDPSPTSSTVVPSSKPLPGTVFEDQAQEHELNSKSCADLFEKSQFNRRAKAIAAKTKRIEEVYRQDCETFGMVVKMLIEKDPSLEKSVQFALKENLSEIGERCIDELKHFIAEYDATSQDFTENF